MSATTPNLHLSLTEKKGAPVISVGSCTFSLPAHKQHGRYLRLMGTIVSATYWIWWSGGDPRDPTVIVNAAVRKHNERFPRLPVTAEDVIVTRKERLTLSRRRREVVELIVKGLTNRQIATQLGITTDTVEQHITYASKFAGVRGRSELAAWYETQGGADGDPPGSDQAEP